MRVGNLTIEPDVLLAPMAAVTDLPFRTVIEEIGVGITITEFLSAHALVEGAKKALDKMTPSLDGRRFGVQIFGREAEPLARAARITRFVSSHGTVGSSQVIAHVSDCMIMMVSCSEIV